jgi:TatD DNase family protein
VIDSHCHLDGQQFAQDRLPAIERALAAGVTTMLAIGTGDGPPDLEAGLRMCDLHPAFLATVGVHPHSASAVTEETYAVLRELARRPKVVAIGEIGLDYHYDFSPRDVQLRVFREHLRITRELGMPIVIHTREAWADTTQTLREEWDLKLGGIFHCFTEGPAQAEEALALGFHCGLGGVVTYPKADALREAVRLLPLDRILLETDAPYLAPVPHRGKRNEPAFLAHTAAKIAELKNIDLAALDAGTSANFARLFRQVKLEQPS